MTSSREHNKKADSERHLQTQSVISPPAMKSDITVKSGNEEITTKTKTDLEESKIEEQEEDEFIEMCSCGHTRNHHLVTPRATYTAWGTFWITLMGVSATPIRVDFICRMCNEKFDFEIDPERLKDFY